MDQNGGGSLPRCWDVLSSEAVAEKFGEDDALGIKQAKVAVFDPIFARSRVGHGS